MARDPESNAKSKGEVRDDNREVEGSQGEYCRKNDSGRRTQSSPAAVLSLTRAAYGHYAVKLLPHPHPPVALGLLNVKPEPCIELT